MAGKTDIRKNAGTRRDFGFSLRALIFVGLWWSLAGSDPASSVIGGPSVVLVSLAGLLLKSALFPLKFRLPPAHANAPAPVSAALSALVVKGSFYLLLRVLAAAFPSSVTLAAARRVPGVMQWAALSLALVALLMGLFAASPLELLRQEAPFAGPLLSGAEP